jgi:hypothetical protein
MQATARISGTERKLVKLPVDVGTNNINSREANNNKYSSKCHLCIRFGQCVGSGMFIPDPGSDFFSSRIPIRIPDPNCLHPRSRIRIKEFKCLNPKKWFLSSRKYDPGCSSRIPDPDADFYPSPIPDPGVKNAPDP